MVCITYASFKCNQGELTVLCYRLCWFLWHGLVWQDVYWGEQNYKFHFFFKGFSQVKHQVTSTNFLDLHFLCGLMLNSVWSFWCFRHFRIVSTWIAFCWIKSIRLFPDIFLKLMYGARNVEQGKDVNGKDLLTGKNVCACCVATANIIVLQWQHVNTRGSCAFRKH